jgi:hypothetical protein
MGAMGKCRSCGAEVVWSTTKNGKRIPLEAVNPNTGNVRVVNDVAVVGPPGSGHYVVHFTACPNAGDWRRDRG